MSSLVDACRLGPDDFVAHIAEFHDHVAEANVTYVGKRVVLHMHLNSSKRRMVAPK